MKAVCFACLFAILTSTIVLARSNAVPLVNQPLVPASVRPGHKEFTLTVNGTGFASTAVLNWNGSPRATSVLSHSSLQATISAADAAKAGTASVTVVNPGKIVSNAVFFPVREPSASLAVTYGQSFSGFSPIVVGDFNGDGRLDVVTGGQPINVFLGNGDGTFQSPIPTNSTIPVTAIASGDFNGDGKLDLIVSSNQNPNYQAVVFLGNGDGTFVEQSVFQTDVADYVEVGDLNGDGQLDLVIAGSQRIVNHEVDVFLGNGNGTFESRGVYTIGGSGDIAIGDFNGDGQLDFAVPEGPIVDVFLNQGNAAFEYTQYVTSFSASAVAAADVNGDGKLDLITNGVSVLLGNGDGTFRIGTGISAGGAFLRIADFNGDGKLDLAMETGNLLIFLGNGDGTFQSPLSFFASFTGGLAIGDFNDDGKLDLVDDNLRLQTTVNLSPPQVNFGNQQIGTTSQPQIATLTNLATSILVIKHIGIHGTNSKNFAQTNNCGSSLPAGASCNISVTFTPSAAGARMAALNVSYKGVGSPQTVALSGTGITPSTVSLKPSHLTYAIQLVGTTSSPQTATLTNTGDQTVNISSISTTGPFGQTNSCPSSLPVGGSCQIQVTFTPTAAGPVGGKLLVTDDAKRSPQSTVLSGTGTVVTLSPIGVNFGDQKVGTRSQPVPVTLTNVGTTTLNISQIAFTGTDPGDFSQTNNCGSSVPAGGSCTIKVRFAPKAKGQRAAKLAVSDDGGGSPQTIRVVGAGT
jgi:hypothetical protein